MIGTRLSTLAEETRTVQAVCGFLNVLAEICFFGYRVPIRRVDLGGRASYLAFTRQQKKFLQHAVLCGDSRRTSSSEALSVLVAMLIKLNNTLTMTSYFLPVYAVDLVRVWEIMSTAPWNLEQLCLRLMGCEKPAATAAAPQYASTKRAPLAYGTHKAMVIRLEGIIREIHLLLSPNDKLAQIDRAKIDFIQTGTCNCRRTFRASDDALQTAYYEAYVPMHDCKDEKDCRYKEQKPIVRYLGPVR